MPHVSSLSTRAAQFPLTPAIPGGNHTRAGWSQQPGAILWHLAQCSRSPEMSGGHTQLLSMALSPAGWAVPPEGVHTSCTTQWPCGYSTRCHSDLSQTRPHRDSGPLPGSTHHTSAFYTTYFCPLPHLWPYLGWVWPHWSCYIVPRAQLHRSNACPTIPRTWT